MKQDKPVSTKVQYWYESTLPAYVQLRSKQWFGVELSDDENSEVHQLLKIYPDEDKDGAIETCLFIFFAKSK